MNIKNYPKESSVLVKESANFSPVDILEKLCNAKKTGCLLVSSKSVKWQIYVAQGRLVYANHSLDSFERLERHLRRLSYTVSSLTASVRNQARLNFENEKQDKDNTPLEYQAINWLLKENYLEDHQAANLVTSLNKEVIELFLLLTDADYTFIKNTGVSLGIVKLDLKNVIIECQQRLKSWQSLAPLITSPEQRPYFFTNNQKTSGLSSEQTKKFSKLLRGFNFRQLAVLTDKDEITIAQYIYKFIQSKNIIIHDPQTPFDQLPRIVAKTENAQTIPNKTVRNNYVGNLQYNRNETKQYKLVCVDDSPTILSEINRFLDKEDLLIHAINDSKKALLEIIRFKPDIILLDVGMPGIDGYRLCQLIRNHHFFKTTPIIMVTGNRGLVDRAKARVAGASDYLTKPFTQSDLLKMVFRYLS
ncbi:response regulator [Crocosphaera chwakensis]|uniref:Protein PatA n=1 Tax=Crocosphaera chwakensis CCY0110 TaxID=391612 RepID=A3IV75_9CHRO|nr:response regulator [Crocosphaera chwakensis]EAZ89636.1 two-component response regulator [Crocosphaera chwakensis CCY0110]